MYHCGDCVKLTPSKLITLRLASRPCKAMDSENISELPWKPRPPVGKLTKIFSNAAWTSWLGDDSLEWSVIDIFKVPPAGVEPAIFRMRIWCPRPLDDGGVPLFYLKTYHQTTQFVYLLNFVIILMWMKFIFL